MKRPYTAKLQEKQILKKLLLHIPNLKTLCNNVSNVQKRLILASFCYIFNFAKTVVRAKKDREDVKERDYPDKTL